MKLTIKIIAVWLALLICTGILVSCDKTDPVQDTISHELPECTLAPFELPEGGYDGSEVSITFYHTMNEASAGVLEQYIAQFNRLYPNIHIETVSSDSHYTIYDKVNVFSLLEKKPNVVFCNSDLAALYAEAKYAVALDDLVNSQMAMTDAENNRTILGLTDEQTADFIEAFYSEGTQFEDGRRYTLPLSKSTEVLYYNKTFFDEKTLEVPGNLDDLLCMAPVILNNNPNTLIFTNSSASDLFITLCAQHGSAYTSAVGNHFLYNNEINHDIVYTAFELNHMYGGIVINDADGSTVPALFQNTDPASAFCYIATASSADAIRFRPEKVNGEYPFEVGIAPIPQVDPENPKVITHGSNVCVFNDENPQKVVASWLFVKYLTTNPAFQAELSMTSGNMPVIRSAIESPAYQDFLSRADGGDNIVALAIQTALAQEDAFFAPSAFAGSHKAYKEVEKLMAMACDFDGTNDPIDDIRKAFEDSIRECENDNRVFFD